MAEKKRNIFNTFLKMVNVMMIDSSGSEHIEE